MIGNRNNALNSWKLSIDSGRCFNTKITGVDTHPQQFAC